MSVYDSLDYLIKEREYKAYMQGLNQEPKYTPVPNGYKICNSCGLKVHSEIYKVCIDCWGKANPEAYEKAKINFRASIESHELKRTLEEPRR